MPMKNFSSHRRLPPLLLYILKNFDAWLIGSSINYVEGHTDTPPKDYDCIVSPSDWLAVAQVLLTQEKIDIVKTRLIKDFGYDEIFETDVLNYVDRIFARGDVKNK